MSPRESFEERIRRERLEQGLPERVEDEATLRRIVALLVAPVAERETTPAKGRRHA